MTRSNDTDMPQWYGPRRGLGLAVSAAVLIGAACSASDDPAASADTEVVIASTPDDFTAATDASTSSTIPRIEDGPLADVCPRTIAIQTASLPAPALGPLYSLLGPEPTVEIETQTVTGGLVRSDGTVEDVELEIRSGGPAVGFRSPLALLSADEGLLLAQASTAEALRDAAATPSIGVVTLTDLSHDAVIVDPAMYPGIDTIEAVRDAGIELRHLTDEPFIAYLLGTGALTADQLVSGFDGEPAAFVQAGGTIAQQGDLLIEPVLFPALPQWGRPVTAIEAASAGWAVHSDALVVRPSDVEDQERCLGRLVPVVQEAIVAYVADPGPTNTVMSDLRSRFAPLARLTPELMDAGVALGLDAGVFGDGANSTVGDFDTDRLSPFLPELAAALGVDAVEVDQLVTNEFVDPSITSAG